jgi:hypothetical protein
MENPTKDVVVPVEKRLPLPGERVVVICKTFRCLGYVDKNGVWRDDAKSKELQDVIGWLRFVG